MTVQLGEWDMLRLLRRDTAGATSIEYSIIAASVGLLLLIAVNSVGKQLKMALAPLTGGMTVHVEAKDTSADSDVIQTGSIRRK